MLPPADPSKPLTIVVGDEHDVIHVDIASRSAKADPPISVVSSHHVWKTCTAGAQDLGSDREQ